MNNSRRPHRRRSGYHFAAAFTLGLAFVGGASWPGRVDGTVSAQELSPCALLSDDDIEPLAAETTLHGWCLELAPVLRLHHLSICVG